MATENRSDRPTRRGWHEGTIRERPDRGGWEARYIGPDGRRRSIYARTRRDAASKLRRALDAAEKGHTTTAARLTVGQFLVEQFLPAVEPTVRPSTARSYRDVVRLHLVPALGRVSLRTLSPAQVSAYMRAKVDQGLSARTAAYHRRILRRALNLAIRWEVVDRNVAALADPPKVEAYQPKPLSPEEAGAMLEAARGDRLEALFITLLATGARIGEGLALRWANLDLDKGMCHITGTLWGGEVLPCKTDRSRRTIRLPAPALEALREHRRRQAAERLLAGPRWQDSGFVFTWATGGPLDGRRVGRWFDELCLRAGIPRRRPYDLTRHSAASFALLAGLDLRAVSDLLGHSSIAVTGDVYAHVLERLRDDGADRMGRLLGELAGEGSGRASRSPS